MATKAALLLQPDREHSRKGHLLVCKHPAHLSTTTSEVAVLMRTVASVEGPLLSCSACAGHLNSWSGGSGPFQEGSLAQKWGLFALDFPTMGAAPQQPWAISQMCPFRWAQHRQPEASTVPFQRSHLVRLIMEFQRATLQGIFRAQPLFHLGLPTLDWRFPGYLEWILKRMSVECHAVVAILQNRHFLW